MIRAVSLLAMLVLAGCASPAPEPGVGADEPAAGLGAIEGLIVGESFRPLEGATVHLVELDLSTVTNESGEFWFTNIPPGEYTVNVTVSQYQSFLGRAIVVADETAQVQWELERQFSTGGNVVHLEFGMYVDCDINAVATTVQCTDGTNIKEIKIDSGTEEPASMVMEITFSSSGPHRIWATQTGAMVASQVVESTEAGFILQNNVTSAENALGDNEPFLPSDPVTFHWQPIGTGPEDGVGVHVAATADLDVTLLTAGLDPSNFCGAC